MIWKKSWGRAGMKKKKNDSWCLFQDYSPTLMEVSGKLSISCNTSWAGFSGYHHNKAELQLVVGTGRYNKNILKDFIVDKRLSCGKAVKFAEENNISNVIILFFF